MKGRQDSGESFPENEQGLAFVWFSDSLWDDNQLQRHFHKHFWAHSYQLETLGGSEANKCKSLFIFRKRFPTVLPTLHVNGSVLEWVYNILQISWSLTSLGLTILIIRISAQKHESRLDHRFYKHASPATLRTLYTALIHPHLEYTVPVCTEKKFRLL